MADALRLDEDHSSADAAQQRGARADMPTVRFLVRSPPLRCDPDKFDREPGRTVRMLYAAGQNGRRRRLTNDEAAQLEQDRAKLEDRTPAAILGVTPLQACGLFGRRYREVRLAYVCGRRSHASIGHRDHWDCWWASHSDLSALFAADPAADPSEPPALQRARIKANALRAKLAESTFR